MNRINDSRKVTLTIGQLKRLIRESSGNEDALGRIVNATVAFFHGCADDAITAISVHGGVESRMQGVFGRIAKAIVGAGHGGPYVTRLARRADAENYNGSVIKDFFEYCADGFIDSLQEVLERESSPRLYKKSDFVLDSYKVLVKIRNILARAGADVGDLAVPLDDFRKAGETVVN